MIERHQHGASTIRGWLDDLGALCRSGAEYRTSAGAEPNRPYAYLEFHRPGGDAHSLLLFEVVEGPIRPEVRALRIDGTGEEVREQLERLVHERAR